MDSFRDYPTEFDLPQPSEIEPPNDITAAIGTDERRMHVRAYNHWVSLLRGRDFPSIEDLEPHDVEDFAAHSVLLDFTCGREDPAIPYVGTAIRDECGLDDDVRTIADVPSRSLLSRLTDHYMQIIANRAPVGFEAEFDNPAGDAICYRGILMPFSSDGEAIDFIYGVINWKHAEVGARAAPPVAEGAGQQPAALEAGPMKEPVAEDETLELTAPLATESEPETDEIADEPAAVVDGSQEEMAAQGIAEPVSGEEAPRELEEQTDVLPRVPFAWELAEEDDPDALIIELGPDAGLADRLWAARESAESVKAGEGRTRAALYGALSLAYDFAIAADANPAEFAELLEESGVKAQARAPMTPIVKLVFGIDYDKARLTEFAAALSFARRQSVDVGAFRKFIEQQPGGLKALVAAERAARRPSSKPDSRGQTARAQLRNAAPIALEDIPAVEEFALVLTRRGAKGHYEPVALVDDEAMVERAIRRAV